MRGEERELKEIVGGRAPRDGFNSLDPPCLFQQRRSLDDSIWFKILDRRRGAPAGRERVYASRDEAAPGAVGVGLARPRQAGGQPG
jgi:hypothetical protein